MPRFQDSRVLPYSAKQMVDLVADVAHYPRFLPWCQGARIYRRRSDGFHADLIIGFKMFRETFSSRVTIEPEKKVFVDYVDGPLKRLYNHWLFEDLPDGGCRIDFDVDFEFKSSILEKLIGNVFGAATEKMISAFEERADEVYGT